MNDQPELRVDCDLHARFNRHIPLANFWRSFCAGTPHEPQHPRRIKLAREEFRHLTARTKESFCSYRNIVPACWADDHCSAIKSINPEGVLRGATGTMQIFLQVQDQSLDLAESFSERMVAY
jgi:hypothetical protein